MGAFNKRMKQLRSGSTGNRILDALQLVIPAVMLTADDIWCVTNEQTQQLVKGSFEIIEGYKDEGGLKALHKEFAERGIQIELHNGFSTPPYKIPERGRGVWQTVKLDEEGFPAQKSKPKTVCSRCGKGTAIKTPYCGWCGADMRPKEDKDA
jgi:hypothetical protein